MGVISFASLKGGVGKTSCSINIAHAFAMRGCRIAIIDFDPSAHTTRFFRKPVLENKGGNDRDPKIVRFLLGPERPRLDADPDDVTSDQLLAECRENLEYVAGGMELRHLYFGRGAQAMTRRFPALIEELQFRFDHIIIDTAPDFNLLTRNALAVADLVVVPVDSSEMSIHSLEELIQCGRHLKRPSWCVLRTMVNRKAKRSQELSDSRLRQRLAMRSAEQEIDEEEEVLEYDIENPYEFMKMLQDWERGHGDSGGAHGETSSPDRPIFLLRSLVYRTEQQNQLSFKGQTAFDTRATAGLAEQYLGVARELETLLSDAGEGSEIDAGDGSNGGMSGLEAAGI